MFLSGNTYIVKEIVEFAKNNPEVTIYVRERNGKHPRIVANFRKLLKLNGCLIKLKYCLQVVLKMTLLSYTY